VASGKRRLNSRNEDSNMERKLDRGSPSPGIALARAGEP
jgi:hypothetical protein